MSDSAACSTHVIDLGAPPVELDTCRDPRAHVTFLFHGHPVGTLIVDTPLDRHPVSVLVRQACTEFSVRICDAAAESGLPEPLPPPVSATVIVCTRDRPRQLERCLASLGRLDSTEIQLSVLVVDNGTGGDDTRRLARHRGFDWVREPVAGLDRARNRGLVHASGHLVLFTDDDVEVDPMWARRLLSCFGDPRVAAAGGLVLPASLATEAQRMIEEHAGFGRGTSRRVIDGSFEPSSRAGSLGAGASMAFRRDVLISSGGFPEELDAGTQTRSGGDTYAFRRILHAGHRGVYEPRALAFHHHRDGPGEPASTMRGYSTGTYAYLLRAVLCERDLSALKMMLGWTKNWIGRRTLSSLLRRPSAPPLACCLAEILGALVAPVALVRAARTTASRPHVLTDGWWLSTPAGSRRESASRRLAAAQAARP